MRGLYVSIGAVVLVVFLGIVFPFGSDGSPNFWASSLVTNVLIYLVFPGGICLEIVDFIRRRQTIEKESSPDPHREMIVTERVLIVCPFCGAKTEQGRLKCQKCDADL